MSLEVLSRLEELKPESNKKLPQQILHLLKGKLSPPSELADIKLVRNGYFVSVPKNGGASLQLPKNRRSARKVLTLKSIADESFTDVLNSELLGGESYPVLSTVVGTITGLVSFGAGLLFAASTTRLNSHQASPRILARSGDEIWIIEEFGKVGGKSLHVQSFWLCDPYRGQAAINGWLIHEERRDLLLN